MKILTGVVLFAILMLTIWSEEILLRLPKSEFQYKSLIFLNREKFEAIFKEADKTNFRRISWCSDCVPSPVSLSLSSAWLEGSHEEVVKPNIDSLVKVAKSYDMSFFRIHTYEDGWVVTSSYDLEYDGLIMFLLPYYGETPKIAHCKDAEIGLGAEGKCHTELFGDWFFIKSWYKKV